MLRVIRELKPAWIVGENVDGIIHLALDDVLADLEGEGYETGAFVLPACGVGAAHRRYRVAIVGHAKHDGPSAATFAGGAGAASDGCPERPGEAIQPAGAGGPGDGATMDGCPEGTKALANPAREQDWRQQRRGLFTLTGRGGENVADAYATGIQRRQEAGNAGGERQDAQQLAFRRGDVADPSSGGLQEPEPESRGHGNIGNPATERQGASGASRREAQRRLGDPPDGVPGWLARPVGAWDCDWDSIPRITDGEPDRVNKLKALGNAVVPQQFYPVFAAIAGIERNRT